MRTLFLWSQWSICSTIFPQPFLSHQYLPLQDPSRTLISLSRLQPVPFKLILFFNRRTSLLGAILPNFCSVERHLFSRLSLPIDLKLPPRHPPPFPSCNKRCLLAPLPPGQTHLILPPFIVFGRASIFSECVGVFSLELHSFPLVGMGYLLGLPMLRNALLPPYCAAFFCALLALSRGKVELFFLPSF